jgi:hypothetical protein
MDDTLFVKIAHTRNELGEKTSSSIVLEVSMVENVVEELTSRGVFENDANVFFRLHHLM